MSVKEYVLEGLKGIYLSLRYSWINILIFEFLYKILVLAAFKPLFNAAINLFAKVGGYSVLINEQISYFLISPAGIALILLMIPVGSLLIYYEFSVLLIFLLGGYQKKTISFRYGLAEGVKSLVSLCHKSFLGFAVYILLLIPSLRIPLYSSLLPGYRLPTFIKADIPKYYGGEIIAECLSLVPVLLFILSCFVIPAMALERIDFDRSVKRSYRILKSNSLRIVMVLTVAFVCWGIPVLFIYNLGSSMPPLLFSLAGICLDILQLFSTPLLLSAILFCYLPYANTIEINDDKAILRKAVVKNLWNNYMPNMVKKRPGVLFTLLIIPAYINSVGPPDFEFKNDCLIIGHRGSVKGVENTIEAVQGAWEQRATFAEVDILMSADNVPMVIHDDNLYRLAGRFDNVHDLTANELKQIMIKQSQLESHIPTLDDLCRVSKGKIKLLLDIKTHGFETENIVDKVVEVLVKNGMEKSCLIQTSQYEIITDMKARYPDFSVGYVLVSSIGYVAEELAGYSQADFFSAEYFVITEELVNVCKEAQKEIYAWTVNEDQEIMHLLNLNVNGIITDFPEDTSRLIHDLVSGEKTRLMGKLAY